MTGLLEVTKCLAGTEANQGLRMTPVLGGLPGDTFYLEESLALKLLQAHMKNGGAPQQEHGPLVLRVHH